MTDTISTQISTKRHSTIIGALSAIMPLLSKLIYPLGNPNSDDYAHQQLIQEIISSLLIFCVPFVVYILSIFINRFIATPEEMQQQRKLKKDLSELEKALDDAHKNPHRYSPKYIGDLKKDYAETRKMLASIGRKSLTNY